MTTGSRSIAACVDELLTGAERREPFDPPQKRSTARFERVWIDGEPHVLKYLHPDSDFMMRALGDDGSRPLRAFAAGLFDAASDAIDHAVVGATGGVGRGGSGCAFLMRDVSGELIPPGDAPRLDVSRDDVIADFRGLYEDRFDETALQLALIGALVQLGPHHVFDVVLGGGDEARASATRQLSWWTERVAVALETWSPI